MRLLPFSCPILAIAIGLPAQTTHVVGGSGGLPQIRDALAIAAPGDTIVVRPGTYAQFDASVGVQIRAETPGTVMVAWQLAFAPPGCANNLVCLFSEGPTRLSPPVGQTLTVVGITFPPVEAALGGFTIRNRVAVSSGRVVLDGCSIQSSGGQALSVQDATVHLVGGEVIGANPVGTSVGLRATAASVTAVGTHFGGSSPFAGRVFAGEAIVLDGGLFAASDIEAHGGRPTFGGPSASAIRAEGGTVWISDSVLASGGPDACALVGGATVTVARCTFGSSATGCGALPNGALLGVAAAAAPAIGQTFTLQWRAQPGDLIGVLWSFDLDTRPLPFFAQPWWAPAGSPTAGLFVADAQGAASGGWSLPANAAFVGLPLWFHSFGGAALPLSTAPVAGGVVR
jgi:hypothetical protein